MLGKVAIKKCMVCGEKTAHIMGSRLVSSIQPDGEYGIFKDSLATTNDICGCPEPKEFIIRDIV
jgi:hypothetical protein